MTAPTDTNRERMSVKKLKERTKKKERKERFYETWTFLIIVCLVLPILFRSLCYAPFHIPSSSMKSTLLIGDFIFVSKASYGYSRYSFPLGIKFFEDRIGGEEPERGDIVVFRPPSMPHVDYIKRLIGLPGDRVQMRSSRLYINGKPVPRTRVEDFVDEQEDGSTKTIPQYIETLPNGVSYYSLDESPFGKLDNTKEFTVPPEHYFMMGDNRDNSLDSRVPQQVGYVPKENLIGKAKIVFISTSDSLWKIWSWFSTMRTDRFLKGIAFQEQPAIQESSLQTEPKEIH